MAVSVPFWGSIFSNFARLYNKYYRQPFPSPSGTLSFLEYTGRIRSNRGVSVPFWGAIISNDHSYF